MTSFTDDARRGRIAGGLRSFSTRAAFGDSAAVNALGRTLSTTGEPVSASVMITLFA